MRPPNAAFAGHRYHEQDLRVRLGEWDVNHDVEFYPYVETDVAGMVIHREFYAGTLYNDVAVLRMDRPVDFARNPHISPACLPDAFSDFTGQRCWTTGWGKDAFGDYGKYQNILKASTAMTLPLPRPLPFILSADRGLTPKVTGFLNLNVQKYPKIGEKNFFID